MNMLNQVFVSLRARQFMQQGSAIVADNEAISSYYTSYCMRAESFYLR